MRDAVIAHVGNPPLRILCCFVKPVRQDELFLGAVSRDMFRGVNPMSTLYIAQKMARPRMMLISSLPTAADPQRISGLPRFDICRATRALN
jgi:hypothetical protein